MGFSECNDTIQRLTMYLAAIENSCNIPEDAPRGIYTTQKYLCKKMGVKEGGKAFARKGRIFGNLHEVSYFTHSVEYR